MLSLSIICILLALWALLAVIECAPWPPKRHDGLYSNNPEYLAAVQRDTAAYLATHTNVGAQIRKHVEAMSQAAQQKLGGMAQ